MKTYKFTINLNKFFLKGVFKLLFFNTYRMDKKHLDMIKNDRKVIVRQKLITYGNIQQHVTNFETCLRVNREHDEILEDLKNNVYPFNFEIEEEIHIMKDGKIKSIEYKYHDGNYIWGNLKSATKKYLRDNDKKFSIFEYCQYDRLSTNFTIYDHREKRFLKQYKDLLLKDEIAFNKLYEDCVVVGGTMPLTTSNKAYMSARRAYKTVKGLALANSNEFKYFCTFTFADSENNDKYIKCNNERLVGEPSIKFNYVDSDNDNRILAFSTFLKNFKVKLKKLHNIELKTLVVPEEHKSGSIHFHALFSDFPVEFLYDNPLWLDYDFRKNKRFFGKGFSDYKYGKSDVQPIQDSEKLSTYIAKYMLKNFSNVDEEHYERYLNKRRYYPSTNLIKPVEKYLLDDKEIDEIMAKVSANTYHEEYINPYNSSTIHKYIIPLN